MNLKWTASQISKLPDGRGSLIRSYQGKNQGYIYDQALAIIAFSYSSQDAVKENDFKIDHAKDLLKGLESLQNKDGSWYFSYFTDGSSPHPSEGDMRPNGSIAWVVLAGLHYQRVTLDTRFDSMWKKALSYLEKQLTSIEGEDNLLALPFASVDNIVSPWDEREIAPLEHAIDTIAALKLAHELTGEASYLIKSEKLKKFVWLLWDEQKGHFWSGLNIKTKKINKDTFYLDNQSWTALLLSDEQSREKIDRALTSACEKLVVKHGGHLGFSESRPARSPASTQKFIWSEGTAFTGLALAINKSKCEHFDLNKTELTLNSLTTENGGVRYINKKGQRNFSFKESVAGSVWSWFYLKKLNPFRFQVLSGTSTLLGLLVLKTISFKT